MGMELTGARLSTSQRRHLFEHNNGMVDEQYLAKTNDNSYSAGQRLVIRKDEIEAVLSVLKKLGTGMLSIDSE